MTGSARSRQLKSPLKWAGGKRWLVPRLAELYHLAGETRLVEPFCGGLSVALGLAPRRALLNDINPHAVNFYRQLQRGLKPRIAMRNDRELYYRHRSTFNSLATGSAACTSKAAQLFYYLNRTGYNGLCRFNSSGEFNVPFGQHRRIRYQRDFSEYVHALAGWCFRDGDFEALELDPDDFVYADPPYDVPFRQYSRHGFDFEEQERLARWLSRHGGPVVASNQATPRIVELYEGLRFDLRVVEAPRAIACNGDRSPAREMLAVRNLPPSAKAALARRSVPARSGFRC